MNKFFHRDETIALIKAAVFVGALQLFSAEIKTILLAVANVIK